MHAPRAETAPERPDWRMLADVVLVGPKAQQPARRRTLRHITSRRVVSLFPPTRVCHLPGWLSSCPSVCRPVTCPLLSDRHVVRSACRLPSGDPSSQQPSVRRAACTRSPAVCVDRSALNETAVVAALLGSCRGTSVTIGLDGRSQTRNHGTAARRERRR